MVQHFRFFTNRNRRQSLLKALGGTVLLTSAVVTGAVLLLRQLGALEGAELSAYDTLMQLRQTNDFENRLLVVGISETDIQTRNEFPIEDGTLAQLLERLLENQPRAIGIDIARDVPQGNNRDALLQILEESDLIAATCVLSSKEEPGLAPPPGVPDDRIGFADLPQDRLGVIRRNTLVSTPDISDQPIVKPSLCSDPNSQPLSLSLLLSLMYLEREGITATEAESGDIQIGSTIFHRLSPNAGGYHNEDVVDYQILLNYGGLESIRQVTLTDVLENRIDPNWVRDRVVLIGYTSQTVKDLFFTPLGGDAAERETFMPGVVIHAHATSQILSAVLDQRPLIWYWAEGVEMVWILGWAVVGGVVAWSTRKTLVLVGSEIAALGVLYGICYLIFLNSGWVPLVPPAIALVISAVGVIVVDRANKGGYTQAIYEQVRDQVKVVLKPKIEIDQEKRAKQVSEITETGYFQDLMQRAKTIREKRATEENTGFPKSPKPPEEG
ncbi:CHASE2 domain-containing protein [Oscillatoria sp. FACHB-1407]|uniref:CHASE2 domain-containing protein n=1 Tax=Oscillatoria sp. FACHB-1407 TaxID=2692847 RepID=UPI001683FB47|nr:CHASE2 domain-containing protein [Oscillatoria sp. FACHB-1407]MBD2465109.1 CHASE2 domain-containing protein [Oscillatoria sp. FACHB-1407]